MFDQGADAVELIGFQIVDEEDRMRIAHADRRRPPEVRIVERPSFRSMRRVSMRSDSGMSSHSTRGVHMSTAIRPLPPGAPPGGRQAYRAGRSRGPSRPSGSGRRSARIAALPAVAAVGVPDRHIGVAPARARSITITVSQAHPVRGRRWQSRLGRHRRARRAGQRPRNRCRGRFLGEWDAHPPYIGGPGAPREAFPAS